MFMTISLAPSFSWVMAMGSTTEPLQRFICSRKPLKRLKTLGSRWTPS